MYLARTQRGVCLREREVEGRAGRSAGDGDAASRISRAESISPLRLQPPPPTQFLLYPQIKCVIYVGVTRAAACYLPATAQPHTNIPSSPTMSTLSTFKQYLKQQLTREGFISPTHACEGGGGLKKWPKTHHVIYEPFINYVMCFRPHLGGGGGKNPRQGHHCPDIIAI